jgi:hypothetical protein
VREYCTPGSVRGAPGNRRSYRGDFITKISRRIPMDDELKRKIEAFREGQKLLVDIFKHVTTLSTGSIVILSTFLKEFFKNPIKTEFIPWIFVAFVVATISSVIVMLLLAHSINRDALTGTTYQFVGIFFVAVACLSFLLGLTLLAIFSTVNF